jgi:predicted GIY-YIG superfamily endonuclease
VLYLGPGIENKDLMARLGKHKAGKGCLYLTRLDDVDRNVLRTLVEESVAIMRKQSVGK